MSDCDCVITHQSAKHLGSFFLWVIAQIQDIERHTTLCWTHNRVQQYLGFNVLRAERPKLASLKKVDSLYISLEVCCNFI